MLCMPVVWVMPGSLAEAQLWDARSTAAPGPSPQPLPLWVRAGGTAGPIASCRCVARQAAPSRVSALLPHAPLAAAPLATCHPPSWGRGITLSGQNYSPLARLFFSLKHCKQDPAASPPSLGTGRFVPRSLCSEGIPMAMPTSEQLKKTPKHCK